MPLGALVRHTAAGWAVKVRIGSLCSGYGGLDMGVMAALGGTVAWHCEFDAAPSRVLAHHWPGIPNHGDITTIDWEDEELMGAPRKDAIAQHMYDRYCQGMSLEDVAAEFNRSRQTVWKMFARRGWDMRERPPARFRIHYDGRWYTLGDVGYYRWTTGDRHYLHRRIWEDANGPIPEGHDIHHRDHDKTNNDLANLQLLDKAEHARLHAEEVVPADTPAVDVLTGGYPRVRASRSATRGSGVGPMTPDTSGRGSLMPFAYYDPDSASLRTSQATLDWDSMPSSPTLPRWGWMRAGELYELPTPGRLTAGSDCSSSQNLPTPTARDWKDGPPCDNVPINGLLGRVVWDLT